jgi:ribonucleoside-diphosphate reductase beta chain
LAVRQLDRVIDLNFYPIASARGSNMRWRPVGLGLMGLQDVFFQLRLPFDSESARALSRRISEEVYFHALRTSVELAQESGAHPSFAETRAASGELQFDAWSVTPDNPRRWEDLLAQIRAHGLRNSLLIAIAPTATIASIAGCCECIEPQISNLFKRETLSGDFLQVNGYLALELKRLGLWTPEMRDAVKLADGSVQGIDAMPGERMYLSRQLFEEALHVQFYLTLLDNYVPDQDQRARAFAAIDNIPSIRRKAQFCQRWTDSVLSLHRIETTLDKRRFLLNLTCFASCIEGLFFFGAFAYVYFLRSRGLLPGLAAGTNWVFRDESGHMAFAYQVLDTVRQEEPELFDSNWAAQVKTMIEEAVECEVAFADDVLSDGVPGLTRLEMREYLQYVADQRLLKLNLPATYGSRNPFAFMELQDVQELTNFFERKVSSYQVAVQGEVAFDHAF